MKRAVFEKYTLIQHIEKFFNNLYNIKRAAQFKVILVKIKNIRFFGILKYINSSKKKFQEIFETELASKGYIFYVISNLSICVSAVRRLALHHCWMWRIWWR